MMRTVVLALAAFAVQAQDIYYSNNIVVDPPTAGITRISGDSKSKTDLWTAGGRIADVVFKDSVMLWCDYDDATNGIYAWVGDDTVDTPITVTTDVEAVHGMAVLGDNLYYTDKTAGTVTRAFLEVDVEAKTVAISNVVTLKSGINQPVGILALDAKSASTAGIMDEATDANAVLLVASYGDGTVTAVYDYGDHIEDSVVVDGRSGLRQMTLVESTLYMVEAGNSAVSTMNFQDSAFTTVVGDLTSPNAVAVTGDGELLIADDVDNALLITKVSSLPVADGSALPHFVGANATRCVTIRDQTANPNSVNMAESEGPAASAFVFSPEHVGVGSVVVLGAIASALVAYRQIKRARHTYMPL